jgi:hypothetical protein
MLQVPTKEAQIILAIEAKQTNPRLSLRRLSKQFNVPFETLRARMRSRAAKADITNSRANLSPAEEEAIVQYILDQDVRGFSPWRADVQDMANLLMDKRGAQRVGKCWTDRFIKR